MKYEDIDNIELERIYLQKLEQENKELKEQIEQLQIQIEELNGYLNITKSIKLN